MASENTAFQFSFPKDRAILLLPLPISGKRVDLSKREIEFRNMECICAHMRVHVHTYNTKYSLTQDFQGQKLDSGHSQYIWCTSSLLLGW